MLSDHITSNGIRLKVNVPVAVVAAGADGAEVGSKSDPEQT